jgi:tetratricopeptide (TPR) repeat protein
MKADGFRPDDDVKVKIVECRYRLGMAEADKLMADGKFDEAVAAYDKLRAIKASAGAEINARIKTCQETQRYNADIAEGDTDLTRQEYDKAIAAYKRAQQEKPTEEAKNKLDNANYQKSMNLGKQSMDGGDFRAAYSYFKQAKHTLDTPEVNTLIKQMEDKIKSMP